MKTWIQRPLAGLIAVATLLTASAAVHAQQAKPALVVSLASVDEIMGDIKYVTTAAGAADAGGFVAFLAQQYTQHLDTTKPAGLIVNFVNDQPQGMAFLPIKNLQAVLQMVEAQVGVKPEDAGGGILKITLDQSIFIKQAGAWVFISNNQGSLANTPADPTTLLGDLVKNYDIGIQANVQSVPAPLRQMAVGQIRQAYQMQMDLQQQFGQLNEEEAEAQKKLAENGMKQLEVAINEIDQFTLGIAIDQAGKTMFIEAGSTAIAGGKLAAQAAKLKDVTSGFAGFVMPDAAATIAFTAPVSDEEKAGMNMWINMVQKKAAEEIDGDNGLPDDNAKKAVKDVLASFMDVFRQTIEAGKIDGGATLSLKDGVTFAAGGFVADGKALDGAFRKLVDLAKNEPDFPAVKMEAAKHGDVMFHTMTMPIPAGEEEARKALGDTIEIAVGTGPKAAYFAFGKNSIDLVKKGIDDSAAKANQKGAAPLLMSIALGPILDFAAQMDKENPQIARLAEAIGKAQGTDKIKMTVSAIDRGSMFRLEVGEGILLMAPRPAQDDGF